MDIANILSQLSRTETKLSPGHVWLAGAGPGDPRYLTLEVVQALSQADCIVYDALIDPAVLDLVEGAEKIYAGKRGGKPSVAQGDIIDRLISLARQGRRVVRLKGGDPFIFGRAGEEILALAEAGVPFRVLPGLSSAFGAFSRANIPLTMRGINKALIFATGHSADNEEEVDWRALARTGQPIVIYMGLKNIASIAAELMEGGLAPFTPVAVVMSAATQAERLHLTTLEQVGADAERHAFSAPAIFAVGEIVSFQKTLSMRTIAGAA